MRHPDSEVVLTIDSFTEKGDGVATWQGKKIFVPGVLPSEIVKVSLHGIKPSYAQGTEIEIQQQSADRVASHCRYQSCGGCQLPHLAYSAQLQLKTKQVETALLAKGIQTAVNPCLGMDEPLHFRNKAVYSVRTIYGKAAIGFYQKNSHDIVDIDCCPVQHTDTTEIIRIIRNWMNTYQVPGYDEANHSGWLRYIMIRHGFSTNECMLVLVTLTEDFPYQQELLDALKDLVQIKSVIQNINPDPINRILGEKQVIVWGSETISDLLHQLKFDISAHSFYQVNAAQTDVLYSTALQYAALTGEQTVFDIYCGIGTISLYLAKQAKKVIGIEVVPQAIDDAKQNALENGLSNTEFFTGKAEEVVPELYGKGMRADVVVVDPPRKGCDQEVLKTMLAMKPERIVYVSCDPTSLARDLTYLLTDYQISEVQPVDMFPHSMHVETVVRLDRK